VETGMVQVRSLRVVIQSYASSLRRVRASRRRWCGWRDRPVPSCLGEPELLPPASELAAW